MEAAALTVRPHGLAGAARPAHGAHRRRATAAAAAAPARTLPGAQQRRHGRLRALPPELSEILAPKLVPGSPADTGDVSSLIPVSALLLLFYFVSNWVFPAVIMKGMKPSAEDEESAAAAAASSMSSSSSPAVDGQAAGGKTRLKVKKKRSRKAATKV